MCLCGVAGGASVHQWLHLIRSHDCQRSEREVPAEWETLQLHNTQEFPGVHEALRQPAGDKEKRTQSEDGASGERPAEITDNSITGQHNSSLSNNPDLIQNNTPHYIKTEGLGFQYEYETLNNLVWCIDIIFTETRSLWDIDWLFFLFQEFSSPHNLKSNKKRFVLEDVNN